MTVEATITYRTLLRCNESNCGLSQSFDLGKVQAIAAAKAQGWTIARNGLHYCPEHPRSRGRRPSEEARA